MSVPCFFCTHWQPVDFNTDTNTYKDAAAKCALKGRYTTQLERCEDGKIQIPGGNNVRAVVSAKADTRTTEVREHKSVTVHNTGSSVIDSKFVGEFMYPHQQKVVRFFETKEFCGLYMQR